MSQKTHQILFDDPRIIVSDCKIFINAKVRCPNDGTIVEPSYGTLTDLPIHVCPTCNGLPVEKAFKNVPIVKDHPGAEPRLSCELFIWRKIYDYLLVDSDDISPVSVLKPGKVKKLNLKIKSIDQKQHVESTRFGGFMQRAVGTDGKNEINISFWDDEVDSFSVGDEIVITDGWMKTFNGQKVVTSGRDGKWTKETE